MLNVVNDASEKYNKTHYYPMYHCRLVTNLITTDNDEDKVFTDDIYTKYTAYVQAKVNATPAGQQPISLAAKTKIGVAIARIFGDRKIKSCKERSPSKFRYSKLRFYRPHEDTVVQDELPIPEFMTCGADENLFLMHVPSAMCYNGERLDFTVAYELKDEAYTITLDDRELDLKRLGIAGKEPLNGRLTRGLGTLIASLRICEGTKIDFDECPGLNSSIIRIKYVSTYLEELTAVGMRRKRSFSKNCLGVLLVTAETKKEACQLCTKDLTQVKTNYEKKKAYDNAAAEFMKNGTGILADILEEEGTNGADEEAVGASGGLPTLSSADVLQATEGDAVDTVSHINYM